MSWIATAAAVIYILLNIAWASAVSVLKTNQSFRRINEDLLAPCVRLSLCEYIHRVRKKDLQFSLNNFDKFKRIFTILVHIILMIRFTKTCQICLSLCSVDVIMTLSKMPFLLYCLLCFVVSEVEKVDNIPDNNFKKFKTHVYSFW